MTYDAELQDIRRRAGITEAYSVTENLNDLAETIVDLIEHGDGNDAYWVTDDEHSWIPRYGSHENRAEQYFGAWPNPEDPEDTYGPGNDVEPQIDQHLRMVLAHMGKEMYASSRFIAMLHGWVRLVIRPQPQTRSVELNIEITNKRLYNTALTNMRYVLEKVLPYVSKVVIDVVDSTNENKVQSRVFANPKTAIGFLGQV